MATKLSARQDCDPAVLTFAHGRTYGRTKGRPLRAGRQALVESLLPMLAVPSEGALTSERLFGRSCRLHFEIGFGGGEHLVAQAQRLPADGFLGAEVFLNGVAGALAHIDKARKEHKDSEHSGVTHSDVTHSGAPHIDNIRLHHGDALDVLQRLPDGGVDYIYLLHPDPWPKARHSKRRIVNARTMRLFADKLAAGGEFRFSTDHPIYLRHTLAVMRQFRKDFVWLCDSPRDFLDRRADWLPTRYETKAHAQGRPCYYLRWRKPS